MNDLCLAQTTISPSGNCNQIITNGGNGNIIYCYIITLPSTSAPTSKPTLSVPKDSDDRHAPPKSYPDKKPVEFIAAGSSNGDQPFARDLAAALRKKFQIDGVKEVGSFEVSDFRAHAATSGQACTESPDEAGYTGQASITIRTIARDDGKLLVPQKSILAHASGCGDNVTRDAARDELIKATRDYILSFSKK